MSLLDMNAYVVYELFDARLYLPHPFLLREMMCDEDTSLTNYKQCLGF